MRASFNLIFSLVSSEIAIKYCCSFNPISFSLTPPCRSFSSIFKLTSESSIQFTTISFIFYKFNPTFLSINSYQYFFTILKISIFMRDKDCQSCYAFSNLRRISFMFRFMCSIFIAHQNESFYWGLFIQVTEQLLKPYFCLTISDITSELLVLILASKKGRTKLTLVINYYIKIPLFVANTVFHSTVSLFQIHYNIFLPHQMKKAKEQILQTTTGNLKFYFSIAQKQNDSGIFFNQRLLFLMAGHHVGYMKDAKVIQPISQMNFDKPKTTILLTNIKSLVIDAATMNIKFYMIDGNKKSERTWIIRFMNDVLAKKWYELLQKEKVSSSVGRLTSPKASEVSKVQPMEIKKDLSPKRKELEISRNFQLSQNGKKQKQYKEVGIGVSPKQQEMKKIQFPASPQQKLQPQEKLRSIMKQNPKNQPVKSPKALQTSSKNPKSPTASQLAARKQPDKIVTKQQDKKDPVITIIPSPKNQKQQRQQQRDKYSPAPPIAQRRPTKLEQHQLNKSQNSSYLINTKYLNKAEGDQSLLAETNKSRDYLERTHELIRTFQPQKRQSISMTAPKSFIFPQSQNLRDQSNQKMSKLLTNNLELEKDEVPWTFKFIKYDYSIFRPFEIFTQKIMQMLIADQSNSRNSAKFKPKLIKNGINHFDFGEIQVKLACMGLQDYRIDGDESRVERVCNKKSVRLLQNQFNNFKALYQYIGNKNKLRVPLVSLCHSHGFVALFKITPKTIKKTIRIKQIQYQLSQLQKSSKIHMNFTQSINNVLVQLDQAYYDQFKSEGDEELSFNMYFIQQIQDFLLPDLIGDNSNDKTFLLRKELIDNYRIDGNPQKKQSNFVYDRWNGAGFSKQLQNISKNIFTNISNIIIQMDSLQIYFLNSKQFSDYLHLKGINIRYLGHIYQNLRTVFQKRFVMTEMAARSCKSLFRKTLQDIINSQEPMTKHQFNYKICDFLNCVLGNTFETAAIWKVISTHAKAYYDFELNFDEIDRGHFIISLIQNCKLDVVWQRIKPEQAFQQNLYFTDKNLLGLRQESKSYLPIFCEEYSKVMKILQSQQSMAGFQLLVRELGLRQSCIPEQFYFIDRQIRKYLSFFVSPQKAQGQFKHLALFHKQDSSCPSKIMFQILLMQVKWALRNQQKEQYIKICDFYIRIATKYFGEFNPIFSQLYDLFSAYHLTCSQFQDAVTFAKSSLVNILKICGGGHEKTAECYYHLALCYIKSNKRDEGILHIRKALAIFQNNDKVESIAYAVMQVKLALLYLNQNQVEACVNHVRSSLAIFEAKADENIGSYEDEVIQCLQILNRSYELLQLRGEGKILLKQCEGKLKRTFKPANLEKILKIYLYPCLSSLTPEQASSYLDILSLISVQCSQENYEKSFKLLRQRISENSFLSNLFAYFEKIDLIEGHIHDKRILDNWQNFVEIFERETVKDFLSLTIELLCFLGEGFISGCLREAL